MVGVQEFELATQITTMTHSGNTILQDAYNANSHGNIDALYSSSDYIRPEPT